MRILGFGRYALTSCVAVATLTGCGSPEARLVAPGSLPYQARMSFGPAATPTPTRSAGPRSEAYKATTPLLYVTNYSEYNDVKVYDAKAKDPSPVEAISADLNGPSGVCIDGDGTLYVVNEGAGAGWVAEFPPHKTKPSQIITKGINTPAFCAIDGNGDLWVTNIGGQNVTEYEKGTTKPHTIITQGLVYPDGIAIDKSGNMYIANHYTEGTKSFAPGNVVVYPSGSTSPKRTITEGVTSPVGIAVGAGGTLYVTNNTNNNVTEYLYGESEPYQTITKGLVNPVAVTVNKAGWLYVTNLGDNVIVEFPPNSLVPSRRQISEGLADPFGTAYFPPLLPKP